MKDQIIVKGARQHNLKNVTLTIPKNKLVVFTGVSGSGKSSMAYDTIYAEGQRRYVESLSSYARQFLGIMTKPDVESIQGLSPSISIDQKRTSHNPRSTVGTITEIYDYLRLLFARVGHPHCPKCGNEISKQSPQQIQETIQDFIVESSKNNQHTRMMILSPIVRDKKGEFNSLLKNIKSKGFQRVRIDNKIIDLDDDIVLIKTNKHTIEVIVDRIVFSKKQSKDKISLANLKSKLSNAVEISLELSGGLLIVSEIKDKGFSFPQTPKLFEDHLFSELFACPKDNLNLPEIEPRSFSFNSPHGACPTCNGLGTLLEVSHELLINHNLSLAEGAILPFARVTSKDSWFRRTIYSILEAYNESPTTKWKNLPQSLKQLFLYGDPSRTFTVYSESSGKNYQTETSFEGAVNILNRRYRETNSDVVRSEIEKYMRKQVCPECKGNRLKKEALSITIDGKNIIQVTNLQISIAVKWIAKTRKLDILTEREKIIGNPILKELQARLNFLFSVGLDYLTLDRRASTLAGGEAQRIRLASQIGSGLAGVLYVLDEPTIGLHQRDNQRLINTLKNLRNLGNSVLVVEHDRETIENADWIVDFGLGAGKYGGQIVAQGTLSQVLSNKKSLTSKYLSGRKKISTQSKKHLNNLQHNLILKGCRQHNLKNIDVEFPLGKMVCITGVSGSGKSTLIHDILYHALKRELNFLYRETPGDFDEIKGVGEINKVRLIDQSPIGRTPRSNPATYTKAFDHIRLLFSATKESAIRGYKPGRFSFNVRGGRCEACQGAGSVKIEMQFLPDVYVKCEVCQNTRFNSETREIRYRGKSIDQILSLNIDEAYSFFSHVPSLYHKLETLKSVGLGYLELGQPAPTLSGGESQRIKIARELSVNSQGHTIYLLDEPTTGLHFADLEKLLRVLQKLVEKDNTVIIIEHNLDVIVNADHIIDLGPDGGDNGGQIMAAGHPTVLSKNKNSHTAKFIREYLKS